MVKHLAVSASFDRLALGYDVARGFMHAQDGCLELIDQLSPSEHIAANVREEILQNKGDTYERIELLRNAFPEVISAIETRAASRSLLNRQRTVIGQLTRSGLLDTAEADRMLESVDRHLQRLHKTPTKIEVAEPKTLLMQFTWLDAVLPETVDVLLSLMEVRIYAAGEVLMQPDDSKGSMVVIARGAVGVHKQGKEELVDEILGPGTVFGLSSLFPVAAQLCVLTRSPVEALWFDAAAVEKLLEKDPVFTSNLELLIRGSGGKPVSGN